MLFELDKGLMTCECGGLVGFDGASCSYVCSWCGEITSTKEDPIFSKEPPLPNNSFHRQIEIRVYGLANDLACARANLRQVEAALNYAFFATDDKSIREMIYNLLDEDECTGLFQDGGSTS